MNYNERDRYRSDRDNYSSHRSDKYRHPESSSNRYRFDDYGDAAHGGYGNESYSGGYGNQGDEGAGHRSRNVANRGLSTYDTSRNYGNMGSYGGAQGFGSSRGGYSSQRRSSDNISEFDSGHGRHERTGYGRGTDQRSHGYESDYDSHGQNADDFRYERNKSGLYGDYSSRRFQGSEHGRYNQDREDYNTRSFGGDRGNYMSSGYDRTPNRTEFGATRGDYGSSGRYMGRGSNYNEPYGMSSYDRGGYNDTDYNSYARDRDERNNDW